MTKEFIKILYEKHSDFNMSDFLFFWSHKAENVGISSACLSQWYPCLFMMDGQVYTSAEQYMMAEKARLFHDEEARQRILKEFDPMIIQKLGRKVNHFNEDIWAHHRYKIVVRGNIAKFSQNYRLYTHLMDTADKFLVEASPKDTVWGIGLDAHSPDACHPHKWPGLNLLGIALMEVRERLAME